MAPPGGAGAGAGPAEALLDLPDLRATVAGVAGRPLALQVLRLPGGAVRVLVDLTGGGDEGGEGGPAPHAPGLFVADVTEAGFQGLCEEQSILVGFADFATHLVALLRLCASGADHHEVLFNPPTPPAGVGADGRLAAPGDAGGCGALGVVELSKFRRICHLSLDVRPATHAEVAARLLRQRREAEARARMLSSRLSRSEKGAEALRAEHRGRAAELQSRLQRAQAEGEAREREHAAAVARQAETHRREVEALKAGHRREREAWTVSAESAEGDLRHRLEDLGARSAAGQRDREALVEQLAACKASLAQQEGRLHASEAERERLRGTTVPGLEAERAELHKRVSGAELELAELRAQLSGRDSMMIPALQQQVKESQAHKAALEQLVKRLEQSAAHFKAAAGKAEQHRAAGAREIVKGNKIIQRLRQDAQAAKRKAKLRLGVIAQQEAALREKEALQGKQRSRLQVAQAKEDRLQAELAGARDEAAGLKEKLGDSQALLDQNQQMIAWLNSQLNDAQLGGPFAAAKGFLLHAPKKYLAAS